MIASPRGARLRRERGFTLALVLWALLVASVFALSAARVGREGFEAGRNRMAAERAYWLAHECAEHARATIDEALDSADDEAARRAWRHLDQVLKSQESSSTDQCHVELVAVGAKIDVNSSDETRLRRLMSDLNRPDPNALVEALLDWRDPDQDPLPAGAERPWYLQHGKSPPRDGPLPDIRELALVRGFEDMTDLTGVLGIHPGRTPLNSAPATVLATVPGFTAELVDRIIELRGEGKDVVDPLALAASLSIGSRDAVLAHFPEVARLTTVDPDGWVLEARADAGRPSVEATIEEQLVRGGRRTVVLTRRSW